MNEQEQRRRVVAESLSWCDTPYHHQGRIKGVGVDCLMLLLEVFERAGVVERIEPGNYAQQWHLHRNEELYMGGLARYARRVAAIDLAQPGDIALYQFGRCYSHGGIFVAADLVVHAYVNRGVILTRPSIEEPLVGRPMQLWTVW
jgi:NlpC/P60 family putative phage cell wall peptidase